MSSEQKQKQKQKQQQQQQHQKGKGHSDAQDKAEQEPPQAIVIADPMYERFEALEPRPATLLPLASSDTPLLDHTLHMLHHAGVSDIVLACSKKTAETVEQHIKTSKRWSQAHIIVANCPRAFNIGDLLREVSFRQLIKSKTFGDVVTNMDLTNAIEAHKANVSKDKACVMTVVFSRTGVHAANRSLEDQTVLGLHPDTNEILLYQWQAAAKSMHVPKEVMYSKKHACRNVAIRADLCDPGIIVCSQAVLAQMQDDFDYKSVTPDLLKGLLDHGDTLGYKAYAYVDEQHYVACVRDLRTYMSVTRDYLGRWVYPLVPDANVMDNTTFALARNAVYKESKVALDKNVVLARRVAIGKNTSIDSDVRVEQSVVGRGCKLRRACVVTGSIVWDNATIGEDASVTDALVGAGAVIGKSAIISRGCVIGNGVRIGSFVTIPPFTQVVLPEYSRGGADAEAGGSDEEDEEDDASSPRPIVRTQDPTEEEGLVGKDGVGVRLVPSSDNPVYNTLVPRDEAMEEELFQGEDVSPSDSPHMFEPEGSREWVEREQAPQRTESPGTSGDDEGEDEDEDEGGQDVIGSFLSDDDDDDEEEEMELTKPIASKAAPKGFLDDDDEEEDGSDEGGKKKAKGFLDDDDDDDDEEEEKDEGRKTKGFLDDDDDDDDDRKGGKRGFLDDDDDEEEKPRTPAPTEPSFDHDNELQQAIAELVDDVMGGNGTPHGYQTQVRSLRMVNNTTDTACCCAILRKLLKHAAAQSDESVTELVSSIRSVLGRWAHPLLGPFSINERQLLDSVLDVCAERGNPFQAKLVPIIIHALYEAEILSEQTIFAWEADMRRSPDTANTPAFAQCADFLQWLHN